MLFITLILFKIFAAARLPLMLARRHVDAAAAMMLLMPWLILTIHAYARRYSIYRRRLSSAHDIIRRHATPARRRPRRGAGGVVVCGGVWRCSVCGSVVVCGESPMPTVTVAAFCRRRLVAFATLIRHRRHRLSAASHYYRCCRLR